MAFFETSAPQNDPQGNPLPPQGAAPGAAPAPPSILSGTGLDNIVAGYLQHIVSVAKNSPIAQQTAAAEAQKKAAATTPAVDRPVPSDDAPPPGSFGSKLGGALGDAFGDAAHASDRPGGWLSGIENTMAARKQRIAQEQKDSVLLAKSQAENIALHRNFYQQDLQHRQQFQEGNQKYFSQYKETNDLQNGVSQEEVFDRMKKDKSFAQNYLVRATGEIPVVNPDGTEKKEKDSGLPVMKPTFTVMKIATKDGSDASKTVDADDAAAYKKYLGLDYPVGTKLTMMQDNAMDIKIAAARDTTNILNKANGKELSSDEMASIRPLITDPTVTSAISEVPGKPYDGIARHMKNADDHIAAAQQQAAVAKQQNNQQALDAANAQLEHFQEERQKLATITSQAINPKVVDDYKKRMGESDTSIAQYLDDPTKISHNTEAVVAAADNVINSSKDAGVVAQAKRAKEIAQNVQKAEDLRKVNTAVDEQTAKEKAAKIDNNPNGLSGDAYIKTLPPGRANLVRALAEGRLPVNATAFERSTAGKSNPLADDVFAAYPDFNATLGEKWPKAWDQYMISGNDHKKAGAYNVALLHMSNLWNNTTTEGLYNPASKAYQDRQVDINQFSREVGNALSTGVLTQSEHDEIVNALDSKLALTPSLKRERIKETAKLLAGKIQTQQEQFEQVRPSAAIQVPQLLLPNSKKSLDFVLNGGEKPAAAGPQGSQPKNTVYMQKPNGDYIYIPTDKQKAAEAAGAKVVNQ